MSTTISIEADSTGSGSASCPAGTILTGGGFYEQDDVDVTGAVPDTARNQWKVSAKNTNLFSSRSIHAYAVCTK